MRFPSATLLTCARRGVPERRLVAERRLHVRPVPREQPVPKQRDHRVPEQQRHLFGVSAQLRELLGVLLPPRHAWKRDKRDNVELCAVPAGKLLPRIAVPVLTPPPLYINPTRVPLRNALLGHHPSVVAARATDGATDREPVRGGVVRGGAECELDGRRSMPAPQLLVRAWGQQPGELLVRPWLLRGQL